MVKIGQSVILGMGAAGIDNTYILDSSSCTIPFTLDTSFVNQYYSDWSCNETVYLCQVISSTKTWNLYLYQRISMSSMQIVLT